MGAGDINRDGPLDGQLTAEQVAQRIFTSARKRAEKRGLAFNLCYSCIADRVANGVCEKTGIRFVHSDDQTNGFRHPFSASLDRIDMNSGYTMDNVQVVVWIYNHAKYVWDDHTVEIMARKLVQARDAWNA